MYSGPGTLLLTLTFVFFLLSEHHWKCRLREPINRPSHEWLSWIVDDDGAFNFELTRGKIVPLEIIDILCDVSTGCEEVDEKTQR